MKIESYYEITRAELKIFLEQQNLDPITLRDSLQKQVWAKRSNYESIRHTLSRVQAMKREIPIYKAEIFMSTLRSVCI